MKKILCILLIPIILTILISNICDIQLNSSVLAAIFTVAGIVFSIGLSLIVTFNMSGIKNKEFVTEIRSNLRLIKSRYLLFFAFSSVIYLINEILATTDAPFKIYNICEIYEYKIKLNIGLLACLSLIFSIIYSVVNMNATQQLNHEIFDEVLKNKKEE